MAGLRELVVTLFTKADTSGVEEVEKKTEEATETMKKFGSALAGIFAVGAVVSGMRELADEADRLQKAGQTLDVGVEKLQAWETAASLAGVGADKIAMGFKQVQLRSQQAADGSQGMIDLFDKIGIKSEELAKKSPDDQLLELGNALAAVEDPARRNALAMQLLGESGSELNRIFAEGPEATKKMLSELEASAPITQEAADRIAAMNDAVTLAKREFTGLFAALAIKLVPVVLTISNALKKLTEFFRNLAKETNVLEAGLVVLTALLSGKFIPMIWNWVAANRALIVSQIKAFALVALAILLVDELITTWQGGDTLITRAIDNIFGEGTTGKIVTFIKDVISKVVDFFKNFSTRMSEFWEFLKADFDKLMRALGAMIDNFVSDLKYLGEMLVEPFKWAFGQIMGIVGKIQSAGGAVLDFFGGDSASAGGSITAPSGGASSINNSPTMNSNVTVSVEGGGRDGASIGQEVASAVASVNNQSLSGLSSSLIGQGA